MSNSPESAAARKRERQREATRRYRKKGGETLRERECASALRWNTANPEKHLEHSRKHGRRRYAVDPAYNKLKREKSRRQLPTPTRPEPTHCECCGAKPKKYALCLDHDHKTNAFRGWLCHRCNWSLGMLGDRYGDIDKRIAQFKSYLNHADLT